MKNKMTNLLHHSAKASHYDEEAFHYDGFNEKNSRVINNTIEKILKKHKVKTVLDITCGTGSQVFWLANAGFKVIGSDTNTRMISVAKEKAQAHRSQVKFMKADMRTIRADKCDAVISIFNAVGHLTQKDFIAAIKNAARNLNDHGF